MPTMHALHKILVEHAHPRPSSIQPGDFLEIEPDVFAIQMAPNAEEVDGLEADLAEAGVKTLPLKERIFPYNDHGSPPPTAGIAAGQKRWREFFRSRGIPMPDGGAGISHFLLTEGGIVVPGSVVASRDSHTPTMGAVGAFAASLAGGRFSLLALGRYWIDVPRVILFKIEGRLQKGVFARDVALYLNGRFGQRGALGKAVEFGGSFIRQLSMDMRFPLCNMGTEMGAMASYIQPDDITKAWFEGRARKPYRVFETDPGYRYDEVREIDVSTLEPQVAAPHAPDNVKPLAEVEGRHIDQAFIGSCAGGRLEDIAIAASVVKGRRVHPDVRFIVTPGSREVIKQAAKLGYLDVLHEAKAIVTNANCGPCCGLHGGILAPGEVSIGSNTRNFKDRMGANAEVYLASPATIAASAIEGRIANPLKYFS